MSGLRDEANVAWQGGAQAQAVKGGQGGAKEGVGEGREYVEVVILNSTTEAVTGWRHALRSEWPFYIIIIIIIHDDDDDDY